MAILKNTKRTQGLNKPQENSPFAKDWLRDVWLMSIIAGLCIAVVVLAWQASMPYAQMHAQTQKTLRITDLTNKVTVLTLELQYWLLTANIAAATPLNPEDIEREISHHHGLMQSLNSTVELLNKELKNTRHADTLLQINTSLSSFELLDANILERMHSTSMRAQAQRTPNALVNDALQDLAQNIVADAKVLHNLVLDEANTEQAQALEHSTRLRQSIMVAMSAALLFVALLTWLLRRSIKNNAALAREINLAARTDPLTGLLNRRAFEERLDSACNLASRLKHPLTFVLIDLDFFKRYNDTYGHVKGDEFLQHCAKIWTAEVRASDIVARLGGEEFGVVMTACTGEQAVIKMSALRLKMPAGTNFSAGVAQWVEGETLIDWYRRADAALYAAKANGRARSEIAPMQNIGTNPSNERLNDVNSVSQ